MKPDDTCYSYRFDGRTFESVSREARERLCGSEYTTYTTLCGVLKWLCASFMSEIFLKAVITFNTSPEVHPDKVIKRIFPSSCLLIMA